MCNINKHVSTLEEDIRVFKAVRKVGDKLVSAYNPRGRMVSHITNNKGTIKTYRPHSLARTGGVGMCSYTRPSPAIYILHPIRNWCLLDCILKKGWKVRYGLNDEIASFSLLVGEAHPLVYKGGAWSIEASTNEKKSRLYCSGSGASIEVEFGKHLTTTVFCPLSGLRWTDGILRAYRWTNE